MLLLSAVNPTFEPAVISAKGQVIKAVLCVRVEVKPMCLTPGLLLRPRDTEIVMKCNIDKDLDPVTMQRSTG